MESILGLIDRHGLLDKTQEELDQLKPGKHDPVSPMLGDSTGAIYVRSLYRCNGALLAMVRVPHTVSQLPSTAGPAGAPEAPQRRVVVVSRETTSLGFEGRRVSHGGYRMLEALPAPHNLGPLRQHLPWTRPVSLRERITSVGMGDRVGLATPGHIRVARQYGIAPVLAQQSMRELAFTGRSFADVVADAAFHVFAEGFESGYGADGDHLKTIPHIDRALDWGMPMVTLDLTDVLHPEAAEWPDSQVAAAFERLPSDFRKRIEAIYVDRKIGLGDISFAFDGQLARRCAVMYHDALRHATAVNQHLQAMTGGSYDLEISIDETTTPTLPTHHLFIARELEHRNVLVSSLAPRFIGEFQKGIDYVGDRAEFDRQFAVHAHIARAAGGYKVSIHSGSDKFSVYPTIGRETGHRVHIKTAGTNWLEALRVIAQREPTLYRLIHQRAFDYFPEASRSYHIGADLDRIRPLDETKDDELELFLEDNHCRQLLHISYGGLLNDPQVRNGFYSALHHHEEAHAAGVSRHLGRHVEALGLSSSRT